MKKYNVYYTEYYDDACNDPCNGQYYIVVEDDEEREYLFNAHPIETIKNIGIDYLAICKKYVSAYRRHEKYSSVFVRSESDAMKIVDELKGILA